MIILLTDCVVWVLWYIIWWLEGNSSVCLWNFYYYKTKNFCWGFDVIDSLYVTFHWSYVSEILYGHEHVGVLYSSSCVLLICVVFGWSVLHLCPLKSQLQYWQQYSGSLMKFSGSLWWTVIRPESIVGDGKLWLRSRWICYSSSSVVMFLLISSNNSSCSTSALSMFCSCVSIIWVS